MEDNFTCKSQDEAGSLQTRTICKHFKNTNQMKLHIKTLLDSDIYNFSCPCCGQRLLWQELRRLELFPESDQRLFEEKISQLTEQDTRYCKKCPRCNRVVQRTDPEELFVECPACPGNMGKPYWFCWNCLRRRNRRLAQGEACKNNDCSLVALLQSCPTIDNPLLTVHGCPTVRACPNCKVLISHIEGCKYVNCVSCGLSFCYRCLEKRVTCYNAKREWYHVAQCVKPMAPRQMFSAKRSTPAKAT
ncbi:E3 ubiquitin-protein ligase RNF217-like isoform X2 [Rhincodon typus]|uniref:E3 ubiquitin-protein ligase RNF217-like isoform X2 n=1 Tax=Rhincodon typus TaxID=259920 RepID=UPI00202E6EE0|nr:E3 ubiquitin-protein ligase RNF217-like isoform X2 [Rhincodon typus]XP_048476183.1 E3 ubiquitin-protein ligase RNF217-like isoform X2 [Rhincodon typus]